MFNNLFQKLSLSFVFLFMLSAPAFAQEQIIEGPYFVADELVTIDTKVSGDVYIAGSNILIQSEIDGDLFILGETVKIDAPINGDVRVIATKLEISTYISGSLAFIADRVYIPATGEIDKDTYGVVNQLIHDGRVGRNLSVLEATPDSTVRIDGKIMGNYAHNFEDDGLTEKGFVQGEIKHIPIAMNSTNNNNFSKGSAVLSKIFHSLSIILIGSILLLLNKNILSASRENYIKDFRSNLLKGTLFLFSLPIILPLLFVSVIGIPLSLILFFLTISLLYVSALYPALYIGKHLLPNSRKEVTYIQLVVGVLIFDIIALAPFVGIIISIATSFAFVGLIVNNVLRSRKVAIKSK